MRFFPHDLRIEFVEPPPVHYAKSGEVRVAYQVVGDGPPDVLFIPPTVSHLDIGWELPRLARFYLQISSFCRFILFDKRGSGLSDRSTDAATLEERSDDVRAVMDAAESERAVLFGMSEGGQMAAFFAATYPERTQGLIAWGTQARWVRTDDYPWGTPLEDLERELEDMRENWPIPSDLIGAPDMDPEIVDYVIRLNRASLSPSAAVALERMNRDLDVRAILPSIQVPTLVLNRVGDPVAHVEAARDFAARIPGARFIELPGDTHALTMPESDSVVSAIKQFVVGARAVAPPSRTLMTILGVDIIASTDLMVSIGDSAFRDLLDRFYRSVDRELNAADGLEVDRAGDGLLATFDGPTRAIRCARAMQEAARDLGLELRAGVHSGEVERVPGGGVRGIAVHTAARIANEAKAGEVVVSRTVKDLAAGGDVTFIGLGSRRLKGLPSDLELFKVED